MYRVFTFLQTSIQLCYVRIYGNTHTIQKCLAWMYRTRRLSALRSAKAKQANDYLSETKA